jgi:hypothetical protein
MIATTDTNDSKCTELSGILELAFTEKKITVIAKQQYT